MGMNGGGGWVPRIRGYPFKEVIGEIYIYIYIYMYMGVYRWGLGIWGPHNKD